MAVSGARPSPPGSVMSSSTRSISPPGQQRHDRARVGDGGRPVAVVGEDEGEQPGEQGIVVDDQDVRGHAERPFVGMMPAVELRRFGGHPMIWAYVPRRCPDAPYP